jgi:aminomuconate-semialdehyde/2-hydroxymuconate-6-semialdehyde dehydrogenase
MQKLENYISGEMIAPASGDYLDNYNPATGEVYSLIPDSEERDVECAVEAAREAFPAWSKMSAEARHDCLMRVSNLIERDLDALAKAESVDNGKPLLLAKTVDIPRAVSNFQIYATAAMHTATKRTKPSGRRSITLCASRSAWSAAFRRGICRFICFVENRARARRRLHDRRQAFGRLRR